MRIVCPDCAAVYEVPAALLGGPARRVRCARCGREWEARPADPKPPEPTLAEPAPPAIEAPPVPIPAPAPAPTNAVLIAAEPLVERAAPRRSRPAALAGWGATLLVLAGILIAAYLWRAPIEAAWPASQGAYAMLGLR
jgi:predicted Zn finger-like uncharacterized protein